MVLYAHLEIIFAEIFSHANASRWKDCIKEFTPYIVLSFWQL